MSDDIQRSALGCTLSVARVGEPDSVQKAEAALLRTNSVSIEDVAFAEYYKEGSGVPLIKPTYDPVQLTWLTHQNNTLNQCVTVMEVNIDGTGYEVERKDGEAMGPGDEAEVARIREFFDEPYPGMSFTKMRRQSRRDQESTGNAYLEVVRNADGEIAFIKPLESKITRLVKLDDPIPVTTTMVRNGAEQNVTLIKQERRYAQLVGNKLMFFKEYGSSRDLNKYDGKWYDKGQLDSEEQATEVLHFTVSPDVTTMYGVPRWINQVPSVLGSRKAEEMNLQFFESGGVPPVLIFLKGGELSEEKRNELTNYLAGAAKFKNRAVIAEVYTTSGTVDKEGSVGVEVERFGTERQNDSMFENYDGRCMDRVRSSFRLPPLFLGKSDDYNFATAMTSYMVAEAQVFKPERDEFDEVINNTVMREIAPEYEFRSKPLSVNDVETQLKAIELAGNYVDEENLIDQLNEIAHLSLTMKERNELEAQVENEELNSRLAELQMQQQNPNAVNVEVDDNGEIMKMEGALTVNDVAHMWADHLMGVNKFSKSEVAMMQSLIDSLSPTIKPLFHETVGMLTVGMNAHDPKGVGELLGCAGQHLKD